MFGQITFLNVLKNTFFSFHNGCLLNIDLQELSHVFTKVAPAFETYISFVVHNTSRILGKSCIESHFTQNINGSILNDVNINDKVFVIIRLLEKNSDWGNVDAIAKNKNEEYGFRSFVRDEIYGYNGSPSKLQHYMFTFHSG